MNAEEQLFFQIKDISAYQIQQELGMTVTNSAVIRVDGRTISFHVWHTKSQTVIFEFDKAGKLVSATKGRGRFTEKIRSVSDAIDLIKSAATLE